MDLEKKGRRIFWMCVFMGAGASVNYSVFRDGGNVLYLVFAIICLIALAVNVRESYKNGKAIRERDEAYAAYYRKQWGSPYPPPQDTTPR